MRHDDADFILTGQATSVRVAFRQAMRMIGMGTPELSLGFTRSVDTQIPEEFREEVIKRVSAVMDSARAARIYRGKDASARMSKINPRCGLSAVQRAWACNQVLLVMRNKRQNNAKPTVTFVRRAGGSPLLRTHFSIDSSRVRVTEIEDRYIASAYLFADRCYILNGNEYRAIGLDMDSNIRRGMEGVRHGVDDTLMGNLLMFGFDKEQQRFRAAHAKVYVTCHRPPVVVYWKYLEAVTP